MIHKIYSFQAISCSSTSQLLPIHSFAIHWPLGLTLVKVNSLSRIRLVATPWTVAHQAPPSMGFSRQEYWSGLPFPSPGDLPNPGIEPRSPASQADALTSEPPGKTWGIFFNPLFCQYPVSSPFSSVLLFKSIPNPSLLH